MIECKMRNIQTGAIVEYRFKYWDPLDVIGHTFQIESVNEYLYVLDAYPISPNSMICNPTRLHKLSLISDEAYQVIGVAFPHSPAKVYHYFIKRKDCFGIGTGTQLTIKTPYGDSDATVVEPCVEANISHATKEIEIIRIKPKTPIQKHTVVEARYIDDRSISRRYVYIPKGGVPKKNQLYWLEENKTFVIVDKICSNVTDISLIREKVFGIPTMDRLRRIFRNPCEEVKAQLRTIDKSNMSGTAVSYIETITGVITNKTHTASFSNDYWQDERGVYNYKINDKKENKTMMNKMMKNLEFGKINTNAIKFSINGLAFRQEDGSYATYNAEKHEFTDVSAFVMDTDFIFAMPVAIKDLKKGDIVKHLNRYVIIEGIFEEDGTIKAVDPLAGEEKVIIPVKNMFGFNYYTKIVNVFENMNITPDAENPFGNILPFMMMRDGGFDDTMMLVMAMQNSGASADFTKNPFMMMMLLNK